MNVCIVSNACPRTFFEFDYAAYFEANGCRITYDPVHAATSDVVVFISCAINEHQIDRSRKIIAHLAGLRKGMRTVVIGCLPDFAPPAVEDACSQVQYVSKDQAMALDAQIGATFPLKNYFGGAGAIAQAVTYERLRNFGVYEFAPYQSIARRTRLVESAFLSLKMWYERAWYKSDYYHLLCSLGCSNACKYCPIKKRRRSAVSIPYPQIEAAFRTGLEKNYRKFYLHSDDLGAYHDTEAQLTVWDMLSRLHAVRGTYHFKLWGINPEYLVAHESALMELLGQGRIKAIVTPLQHASQRVLDAMNRRYDIHAVVDVLQRINRRYPHVEIVTEFMLGFMEESEEDFQAILRVLKQVKLSPSFPAGCFRYYHHPCMDHTRPVTALDATVMEERLGVINRHFVSSKRWQALAMMYSRRF